MGTKTTLGNGMKKYCPVNMGNIFHTPGYIRIPRKTSSISSLKVSSCFVLRETLPYSNEAVSLLVKFLLLEESKPYQSPLLVGYK